jgi:hypothetical protein
MKYIEVKNLKWSDEQHSRIDCEVNFENLNEEFVPFTADPNDPVEHGKDIYNRALNGDFGIIAEYEPPPIEYFESIVRNQRDDLLTQFDSIVSNPFRWQAFTAEEQQALGQYRQDLLDVPQQTGFPYSVTFPILPITL